MASRNDLRIGTSGWSYPTGEGTWNGIFYPPKSKKFEELGRADAERLRVLAEALSEVHAPEDVQGGGAEADAGGRRPGAGRARDHQSSRRRCVQARARSNRERRQARRPARAVSAQLQG